MNEIATVFGINGKLLLIQIVNFLLLLVILKRYLYKPLLEMIDKRKGIIEEGISNALLAEERLAEVEKRGVEITSKAQEEGLRTVALAKEQAQVQATALLERAEKEKQEALHRATLEAEKMKAKILRESEIEVTKLALLAAEKILREKGTRT